MQYRISSFSVQYVAVKRLPHFISDEEWRRLARQPVLDERSIYLHLPMTDTYYMSTSTTTPTPTTAPREAQEEITSLEAGVSVPVANELGETCELAVGLAL